MNWILGIQKQVCNRQHALGCCCWLLGWLRKCILDLSTNMKNGGGMVELGRRLGRICFRGDEAGQMNGLGEAGLIHPTQGGPNHAQKLRWH